MPPAFSHRSSRRTFLVASTVGFAGLRFGTPRAAASPAPQVPARRRARSTILFFLCGGASHIDTWDMKPDAPREYRGPFNPIRTSAPDIRLCEHLPCLARHAHHLAVVRSVTDYGRATGDHHAGYYYNLTGHPPDRTFRTMGNDRRPEPTDWPFMGSVVGSRMPVHPSLPQIVTLPHKPSRAPYTRPGQFAARLGVDHDPFYIYGQVDKPLEFTTPALTLQSGVTPSRLAARRELLTSLETSRRNLDDIASVGNFSHTQHKAFSLLGSTSAAQALDIALEPDHTRKRYGETINGMSLLMARRLVEAGVPFVTVFWKENEKLASQCKSAGGWDTHGNNFNCLKDHLLPEFDQGFSALVEDLHGRDLLDETLLLVTSEMGRKPRIGDSRSGGIDGAGRDHWTACMSVLFAGGGIQGGTTVGATDRLAEYPSDRPVGPEDIAKTVYYAMGIKDLQAVDLQGRPFSLLQEGQPLVDLF